MIWLAVATSASAAGLHADRLAEIGRALAAQGYQNALASKDHWSSKYLSDGSYSPSCRG